MINRPHHSYSSACALMAVLLLLATACDHATGQRFSNGTSSRKAKKQAIQSIPYDQLTAETQNKISTVVDNASIYRRLPITAIDVDPDMFLFLVRYPEVVVNIWEIMSVTKMSVERTGPFNLASNDGAGAVSDIELVYGTNNHHIFYAEGTYSGTLIKRKLKGSAVMILNTSYATGPSGEPQATNSLDVFVKVENATVNLIAKTLSPVVGPTADHNFVESLNFVQRLNETTEKNGVGVQRMAGRLTKIDDPVRQKFIDLAGLVYRRSVGRSSGSKQIYAKPAIGNADASTNPSANSNNGTAPASRPPVRRTGFLDFFSGAK